MRLALALLLLPVLFGCRGPAPRTESPAFRASLRAEMERWADALDAAGTPGFSVAALRDGEIAEVICRGIADGEGTPVTPETNFRLASITKQFTAMAILLLRERGALTLDDTLDTFFPELPSDVAETVTVHHLLTHTSGVIAYENLIPEGQTEQVHDSDVLALLGAQHGTYFTPGTDYRYSNTGYSLLALIVERVSGMTFAEFLDGEIFAPLGMDGSVAFEQGISTVPHRAFGFALTDGEVVPRDQSVTSAVLGDGGVYSSVVDYAKWDRALFEASLAPRRVVEEAITPHAAIDEEVSYGYGWRVEERDGVRLVHHNGSTSGFRNAVRRLPDSGWTVLILTNLADAPATEAADALIAWLIDHAPGV